MPNKLFQQTLIIKRNIRIKSIWTFCRIWHYNISNRNIWWLKLVEELLYINTSHPLYSIICKHDMEVHTNRKNSLEILTQCAYIGNGKELSSILQQSTWQKLPSFYDIILFIVHVSLTLNSVTSFLHITNVRNPCKHLLQSKIFVGVLSAMEASWKNLKDTTFFHSFLCIRIQIDQSSARIVE